jgi:hypothetical protein
MKGTAQPRHSVRELEHLAQARSYLDSQICCQARCRIWCRVVPRPRQLGAFPPDPFGGRAAPRIPPATGAPSNRPARRNFSAALTAKRRTHRSHYRLVLRCSLKSRTCAKGLFISPTKRMWSLFHGRVWWQTMNYWSSSIRMRLMCMSSTARSIPTCGQTEKNFAFCFHIHRSRGLSTWNLHATLPRTES